MIEGGRERIRYCEEGNTVMVNKMKQLDKCCDDESIEFEVLQALYVKKDWRVLFWGQVAHAKRVSVPQWGLDHPPEIDYTDSQ